MFEKKLNLPKNFDVDEAIKSAALEEWTIYFNSTMPISSISQMRQIRLFCLIKNVFENNIPTENQVADLFRITPTTARSLIAGTQATYRRELENSIWDAAKNIMEKAKEGNLRSTYIATISSSCLLSFMNEMLRLEAPDVDLIRRIKTTSQYTIAKSAREFFLNKGKLE